MYIDVIISIHNLQFNGVDMEDLEKAATILKALSHPTRIQIVRFLAGGEKCVKDIWNEMGIPQPTASQHINVLKNAGVIFYRKDGAKTCYRIKDKRAVEILKILLKEV